jgi:hypothetical protein
MYPMTMEFESSIGDLKVVVSRERWLLVDRPLFDRLPAAERLSLRRQFAAQVELAKNTPTRENT